MNEATGLLEKKGRLADLMKRMANGQERMDAETFEKVNADYNALEKELTGLAEERSADADAVKEEDETLALLGLTGFEQDRTRELSDIAFREYLLFGEPRSELGREGEKRTRELIQAQHRFRLLSRPGGPGGMELRDQNIGTPGDGGYLTHPKFANELIRQLKAFIGVTQVARVLTTDTGSPMYWPTTDTDKGERIDEAAAQTDDTGADIAFGQKRLDAFKVSSKIVRVSRELLYDSELPIGQIVGERVRDRVARKFEELFTTGDGAGDPQGFVPIAPVGTEVTTAAAMTGGTPQPTKTQLLEHIHTVDPAYRRSPSCAWLMHDTVLAYIRSLDDTTNNLMWQPSLQLGVPDTLQGYPVVIANEMLERSAVDANDEKFIVFGDFRHFMIRLVRAVHFQRLDELYAKNDQVGFFAVMRADSELIYGGAAADAPIKAMSTTVT
ncbi:MAG: phage major capsid protein [Myxococcota bacterium]